MYVRTWLSGKKLDGRTNVYTKRIYLKHGQDPDNWEDTLLHEVLHACFEESGAGTLLHKWSKSFGQADYREEKLIQKLTPVLLVALKSLGWEPPKEPE